MASLVFKRRVEGRRQKENDNRSAGAEEGMVGPGLGGGAQGGGPRSKENKTYSSKTQYRLTSK